MNNKKMDFREKIFNGIYYEQLLHLDFLWLSHDCKIAENKYAFLLENLDEKLSRSVSVKVLNFWHGFYFDKFRSKESPLYQSYFE